MIQLIEEEDVTEFLADSSNLPGGHMSGLAIPESEEEVVAFLRDLSGRGMPVTIAGNGSGLVGGRVPFGGWVLSTHRLDKVISVDVIGEQPSARVEPGVRHGCLNAIAEAGHCFFPPDPTEPEAFSGGIVSTNASGARSFKYGPVRDHVLSLRVVLMDGRVLALRRGECLSRDGAWRLPASDGTEVRIPVPTYRMPKTKHVAGYFAGEDAMDLFIGSEGTLGVITQIEFALRRIPEAVFGCYAFFRTEDAAWRFAIVARERAKASPKGLRAARAIEYLDTPSLDLLRPEYPDLPAHARASIYVEQETSARRLSEVEQAWRRQVVSCGGMERDTWTASTPEEYRALKAFRRALPVAVNRQRRAAGQTKVGTDMAVPDEQLIPLLRMYRRRFKDAGLPYCVFGHIGDNHLHANMMPSTDEELATAWQAYDALAHYTISLGGTISAEHGIGKLKRRYLAMMYSEQALDEMRAIKRALDPQRLLGRGNIFE